jgi:hypothetical protein
MHTENTYDYDTRNIDLSKTCGENQPINLLELLVERIEFLRNGTVVASGEKSFLRLLGEAGQGLGDLVVLFSSTAAGSSSTCLLTFGSSAGFFSSGSSSESEEGGVEAGESSESLRFDMVGLICESRLLLLLTMAGRTFAMYLSTG